MADDSWRTAAFRQNIVAKIDEAIKSSGTPTSKNSVEMEQHVFVKAKSREEYLSLVARLILHVREMNSKKGAAGGMNAPGGGGGGNQGGQGGPGMPDPINALQSLASHGTRNNLAMMQPTQNASNILQTLNHRPQGIQQGVGMQQGMVPGMQGMVNMQNKMAMGGPNPAQQMGNQMMGQMPASMAPQMTPNQMMPTGQMVNTMQNPMIQQRKPGDMSMVGGFTGPRNVTPNPYTRQSPTLSPAGPPTGGGGSQMVPSPALVPSPGSQMLPRSVPGMAPSPGSSSLNTPRQAVPTPSPLGMNEDELYREKVRQLSKYIDPLRKMIARTGNDGEHVEKLSKMKKLLGILSNPSERTPLETLLKCEIVLEKLDLKRGEGGSVPSNTTTQLTTLKEHHFFNPLLEAVNNSIQSTSFNHTVQRTFGPSTEALNGPEIKGLPAPLKRKRVEEPTSDIPDVLQGEIARLDNRFKVSLDPIQQLGSRTVQLICWLDDRHLPCVPPVSLSVPEDYPKSPPNCHMAENEYTATPFLTAVQKALLARISKLPKQFSVSQLLDTWEMSVRQACAPTQTATVTATTVLMGL